MICFILVGNNTVLSWVNSHMPLWAKQQPHTLAYLVRSQPDQLGGHELGFAGLAGLFSLAATRMALRSASSAAERRPWLLEELPEPWLPELPEEAAGFGICAEAEAAEAPAAAGIASEPKSFSSSSHRISSSLSVQQALAGGELGCGSVSCSGSGGGPAVASGIGEAAATPSIGEAARAPRIDEAAQAPHLLLHASFVDFGEAAGAVDRDFFAGGSIARPAIPSALGKAALFLATPVALKKKSGPLE